MLGFQLAWWCFNKVLVNFVNVMLGLRLTWLHKVYYKTKIFKKKERDKINSTHKLLSTKNYISLILIVPGDT